MSNRVHLVELAICWFLVGLLFSVYGLIRLGFFDDKAAENLITISLEGNICCMDYLDTGNDKAR